MCYMLYLSTDTPENLAKKNWTGINVKIGQV